MELKYELVHVCHTKLRNQICFVSFEVFAAAIVQISMFHIMTTCEKIVTYQRFGRIFPSIFKCEFLKRASKRFGTDRPTLRGEHRTEPKISYRYYLSGASMPLSKPCAI